MALLIATTASAFAQPYDLKPENWFPLNVGSYWHYEFSDGSGFTDTVVQHAEKDTLVDGQRWVNIKHVYCAGPNCIRGSSSGSWYRFTEDHYLLQEGGQLDAANADTVLATSLRSIFSVNVASDTLDAKRTEEPMLVSIETNEMGNETDSTHLLLFARINFIFSKTYVYKIGPAQSLVGAVVGNLNYGDTSLIASVALPVEEREDIPDPSLTLDVFPNPASTPPTIRIQALQHGLYQMSVYNLLGQRVFEAECRLSLHASWQPTWDTTLTPHGIYFIQVKRDGLLQASRPLIVAQ